MLPVFSNILRRATTVIDAITRSSSSSRSIGSRRSTTTVITKNTTATFAQLALALPLLSPPLPVGLIVPLLLQGLSHLVAGRAAPAAALAGRVPEHPQEEARQGEEHGARDDEDDDADRLHGDAEGWLVHFGGGGQKETLPVRIKGWVCGCFWNEWLGWFQNGCMHVKEESMDQNKNKTLFRCSHDIHARTCIMCLANLQVLSREP